MAGAKALAGKTTDVEWVASAAMDMLFLDTVADYNPWPAAERAIESDGRSTACARSRLQDLPT